MLIGQHITVLGGGIAGLAVATALAQRGAQVTVLEQADAIREVGAGLQISPNGVAVLRALGLESVLKQTCIRGRAVNLCDGPSGKRVLRLDMSAGEGGYYFVHRADLVDMLATAARAAGVRIRLLQQVTDIAFDEDGARLTMVQGAEVRAGLVLGADGLHSVLRGALNGVAAPRFTGQVAWRATVPLNTVSDAEVKVFMGPGRHLVRYPLRDGKLMNIVAVEERSDWAEESWSTKDDPANLRAAFAGFAPEVRDLLAQVDEVFLWGLFRHPVAQVWQNGRAAILGDAAHPTLPFMAQGANMALEDAWVLAASLAGHDTPEAGLAAYQLARRDRCIEVVDAASKNARNYHLTGAKRTAGHLALKLVGAVAPDLMLRRFDWIYRHDVTRLTP